MVSPNAVAPAASYIAVLKAKRGELIAVSGTSAERFIPLLEVLDTTKHPVITKNWPHADHALWVHPINVEGAEESDWADSVADLFSELRAAGTAAVPTATLEEYASTYSAFRDVVAADGRGLVLRIPCESILEETSASLLALVDQVLEQCGVQASATDLVIDGADLTGQAAPIQAGVADAALAAVPYLDQWRNVVVAFSAFPGLVGEAVSKSTVASLPRTDAAAFGLLISRWSGRLLLFGDFAVGSPTYGEARFSPIPNIRYALEGEWRVHRAASKDNPSPQYRKLASDLVSAPYFSGAAFSPGDGYWASVATGADGPGNPESHLRAAMSRHFHVVLAALSTHGAP